MWGAILIPNAMPTMEQMWVNETCELYVVSLPNKTLWCLQWQNGSTPLAADGSKVKGMCSIISTDIYIQQDL